MKRADAICTAYRSATKGVARPRSYDAVVAYVRGTLPLYEDALRKLRALKPPSQDATAVRTWLAADGDVARATRALGVAAQRRDSSSIDVALARVDLASSRGRRAAAGLGMRVCGTLPIGR